MAATPSRQVTRERERIAWDLRQQCWTEQEIADHIGITQQSVNAMLQRIERRVLEQLKGSVESRKATQTLQLERIASQALRAWERSLKDAESVKTIISGPGDRRAKQEQVRLFLETFLADDDEDVTNDRIDVLIDALSAGDEDRVEKTLKGQSGNPALLAQAREALADIRKIWGMDAPTKVGLGGLAGAPVGVGFVEVEMPPDGPDGSTDSGA